MTARERKASGGISATATAPHAAFAPAHATGRNGVDATTASLPGWEEWFQNASLAQRQDMLALAARQGLIYASQLPPPANGVKKKPLQEDAGHLQALARLFRDQAAGTSEEFAPVVTEPLTFVDEQLDSAQQTAVARALFTPDVFLLQGLPGTGRSRVVAEILNQAALRGQKVLFLASHSSSLHAVLQRLVPSQAVLPLLFHDPLETPAMLPPQLAPFLLANRQRDFREQALQNAVRARADAQGRLARRQAEEACWAPCRQLADQIADARQRLRASAERVMMVPDEVQRDGSLAATIAQCERDCQLALNALVAGLAEQERHLALTSSDLTEVHREIQKLGNLTEAKRRRCWWKAAWWRAMFHGGLPEQLAALEVRRQALELSLQTLEQDRTRSQEKRRRLEDQFHADRLGLLEAATSRRRQDALRQESDVHEELRGLAHAWRMHVEGLEIPAHRPVEETRAAVDAASARWDHQRCLDAEAYQFACRWADYLAAEGDQLGARISEWATVVAGTMAALCQDSGFKEAARGADLLVLEEADHFTETDFYQAARRAPRCVLVAVTHGAAEFAAAPPANGTSSSPSDPLSPRLGCFQKLWRSLHGDSRRLRYAWTWESGRLCCTLRPVSRHERVHLEIERVADFPEIELRILAIPKAPPLLAQVVFPAAMTIHEAKYFIYRELQEVAIQGCGRGAWLAEEADAFVLHLGPSALGDGVRLELEHGLGEWIVPATARTCRLEFNRAAGWTRAKVDQWLVRYLDMRDLGRTMALHVPYRMRASLAAPLNEILFAEAYLPAPGPRDQGALEFIAVPPLRTVARAPDKRAAPPGGNGWSALPREGAGLELDLTTQRSADRMPADLRAELPRRGFANYLEAQAVIRRLEELINQGHAGGEPIAVIALYEGQVALLRRLADRSDSLRRQPDLVEIGLPSAFQDRERAVVLVSLTRSHGHRAVPWGERESDLALAMTRARSRLILFGDAGALVKRSQWRGPLDHLDAAAAAVEARRVAALVRWLDGSIENPL